MIRWTITGTIGHDCTLYWAMPASVCSGSNLRCRTIVVERSRLKVKCVKPHEWKRGAAIRDRSRAFSGIRSSMAAAGRIEVGWLRDAPLGVPVVPDVRITARYSFSSDGGTGSDGSPCSMSSSRVGSSVLSESCHAMNRLRRLPASSRSSVNSSS